MRGVAKIERARESGVRTTERLDRDDHLMGTEAGPPACYLPKGAAGEGGHR